MADANAAVRATWVAAWLGAAAGTRVIDQTIAESDRTIPAPAKTRMSENKLYPYVMFELQVTVY
jgi:hypothetical protein